MGCSFSMLNYRPSILQVCPAVYGSLSIYVFYQSIHLILPTPERGQLPGSNDTTHV